MTYIYEYSIKTHINMVFCRTHTYVTLNYNNSSDGYNDFEY